MRAQSSSQAHSRLIEYLLTACSLICSLPENEKSNRIDSNLFQSAPGSAPLLNFGSYLRGLFQVPLTLPPMELNGKVVETVHNASNVAMEAAYQFQWTVGGKQWYVHTITMEFRLALRKALEKPANHSLIRCPGTTSSLAAAAAATRPRSSLQKATNTRPWSAAPTSPQDPS